MENVEDIIREMIARSTCIDLSGDAVNTGINFIDRREQRYYRVTDQHGAMRIIDALDSPINDEARNQGRFVERSYGRISGVNIQFDSATIRGGRLNDLCVFIFTELNKRQNVPSLRFYFTYNHLAIPQLRMSFKSRVLFVSKLREKCANTKIDLQFEFHNIITRPTAIYEVRVGDLGIPVVAEILVPGDDRTRSDVRCRSVSIYLPCENEVNFEMPDEPIELPTIENRDLNIQMSIMIPEVHFAHDLIRMLESTRPEFFVDNIDRILSCLIFRSGSAFCRGQHQKELNLEFAAILDHSIRMYSNVGKFAGKMAEEIKTMIYSHPNTSVSNLVFWCFAANQNRYSAIVEEYIYRKLRQYVLRGEPQDHDYAQVMFYLGCHRYGVQSIIEPRKSIWYEFVTDGNHEHGFKWRVLASDTVSFTQMSQYLRGYVQNLTDRYNKMLQIDDKVRRPKQGFIDDNEWLDARILDSQLTNEQLVLITRRLAKSYDYLGRAFKDGRFGSIVNTYFDRTDFFNSLNKDPYVIGVHGGVVELATPTRHEARFIREYHPYAVSWSAGGTVVDKSAVEVKFLLDHWNRFFIEDGVADWTLMFLAQGLDAHMKAPLLLIWAAPGSRAKTFWSELTMNAIGLGEGGVENSYVEGYGTKINNLIFADEGRTAHSHTTAIMKMVDKRAGVVSEGPLNRSFGSHVLKMFFGLEMQSGRQINERERNIRLNLMMWYVANSAPKIDSVDYGTRRRLVLYQPKYTFLDDPDPSNPLHRKADAAFSKNLKDKQEYKDAWLTILIHAHKKLQTEYGGDIEKVPMPEALRRETSEFIYSNDPIYQFAVENLVACPNYKRGNDEMSRKYVITDTEAKNRFSDWFQSRLGAQRPAFTATISTWSDSFLGRWIHKSHYGEFVIEGVRFFERDDDNNPIIEEGERRFSPYEWTSV